MKKVTLALLFVFISSFIAAGAAEKKAEEETELTTLMTRMSKSFRTLRRQVSDPAKNPSSLELMDSLLQDSRHALELAPAMAAEIPADQREAFVAGYKKQMEKTIGVMGKLTDALRANDNAAAAPLIAELSALQKSGHREYRKEDDDK